MIFRVLLKFLFGVCRYICFGLLSLTCPMFERFSLSSPSLKLLVHRVEKSGNVYLAEVPLTGDQTRQLQNLLVTFDLEEQPSVILMGLVESHDSHIPIDDAWPCEPGDFYITARDSDQNRSNDLVGGVGASDSEDSDWQ